MDGEFEGTTEMQWKSLVKINVHPTVFSLPEKKASEINFVSSTCFENFVILVSSACVEKFTIIISGCFCMEPFNFFS